MNEEKKGGLNPLPKDERDFQLGAYYSLPSLSELPESFSLGEADIKHQGDTDFCTAFASCGASELQEGVRLNPLWSFAKSKEISGDMEEWGQDLRTALKVHTKFGAVEMSEMEVDNPRDIKTYSPLLEEEAKKHKKKTYLSVSGKYDDFDNIRASIWKFRSENRAVVFGIQFGWPLSQIIMENPAENGFGHALFALGWKVINDIPYLEVVNSYGKDAGENGKHYFGRDVINKWTEQYGAFMFVDMPPEDMKRLLDANIKETDSIFTKILKELWYLIKSITKDPNLSNEQKMTLLKPISESLPSANLPPDTLNKFCLAIQSFEGWFKDSRSWKGNNPGNIKNKDGSFMLFPSYEAGFSYLREYVKRVGKGKHFAYPQNCDIKTFFSIYAPSYDKNNPTQYADFVCQKTGLTLETKISELS